MKKIAIAGLMGLCFWTGCSSTDDTTPQGITTQCASAKCDGSELPDLQAIPTHFGNCDVIPELTSSDFFAVDSLNCQFAALEEGMPITWETVHMWAEHKGGHTKSTEVTPSTNEASRVGWYADKYPVTTTIRTIGKIITSDFGRLGEAGVSTNFILFENHTTHATRPTQTESQQVSLPIEFWPVVIWPSSEFAAQFTETRSTFSVYLKGAITSQTSEQKYTYGRFAIQGDDLRQLPAKTFFLPVEAGKTPNLEVRLNGNDLTSTTPVTGPGYFLLNADGSVVKLSAAEILEKGMSRIAGEEPTTPEPEPILNPGVPTEDPSLDPILPEPEPEVDPCNDTCSNTQVCVNAACVSRADQLQYSNCSAPTAVCETTSDCADEHTCAEGLCRRLTCQRQYTSCQAPTAVCAVGTDCNDGHACVEGLCRRLTCQRQYTNCENPTAVCNLNSDCDNDHACAGGLCRRLTCQRQYSNCETPTAVCDGTETSDCADGHVCEDSICKRLTCIR